MAKAGSSVCEGQGRPLLAWLFSLGHLEMPAYLTVPLSTPEAPQDIDKYQRSNLPGCLGPEASGEQNCPEGPSLDDHGQWRLQVQAVLPFPESSEAPLPMAEPGLFLITGKQKRDQITMLGNAEPCGCEQGPAHTPHLLTRSTLGPLGEDWAR